MAALRRPHAAPTAGFTLVELLITIFLVGVIGSLVVAGVHQASRVLIHAEDENLGLQDAKVILDRLSRDVRQARGVVCDGAAEDPWCRQHLQLWMDTDSDYLEDPEEVVTWELEDNPDGEHFDVWRVRGVAPATPTRQLQASALIVKTLFEYNTPENADPSGATLVTMRMQYDALVGVGVDVRQASVSVRLRNKG